MNRVALEVAQGVVHPAHVPLEVKAEPGFRRDAGPCGGFLCHDRRARAARCHGGVEFVQEMDGFVVFAPAVMIGDPCVCRAAVVAVEHRGDGIDPQAVDMKGFKPRQRAGDQKTPHLGPPDIVDQRVPVMVEALTRVFMLVKRRAVEPGKAMGVGRKMGGHPVDDYADVRRVAGIDERCERRGVAKPGCGREQRQWLVAP